MSPVEPGDQVYVPTTPDARQGFETYGEAVGYNEALEGISDCGTTGVTERDGRYYPTCVSIGVVLPSWEIALGTLLQWAFPEDWQLVPPG